MQYSLHERSREPCYPPKERGKTKIIGFNAMLSSLGCAVLASVIRRMSFDVCHSNKEIPVILTNKPPRHSDVCQNLCFTDAEINSA